MDLHYSQTSRHRYIFNDKFYYLMDLHYSQTIFWYNAQKKGFTTLWIYTILKPAVIVIYSMTSFTTLWIYTILKLKSD